MIDVRGLVKRHGKFFSFLGMMLIVGIIFGLVNDPAIVGVTAVKRSLPVYCVQREDKTVALSFDAAWGNEDTKTLIDILEKYGVKTTFFVVGDWVNKYPESVHQLSEAGHEVMNHSMDHAHFSKLGESEIISNIEKCNELIKEQTSCRPTLFRCPYGEYDDHVIETVRSMGMTPIQWDVDSLDWKEIPAGEIQSRVLKKIQPGSIVLFHNAAKHTPEALPGIIEALQRDGYTIVPISQILLTGNSIIDHTGKQLPA